MGRLLWSKTRDFVSPEPLLRMTLLSAQICHKKERMSEVNRVLLRGQGWERCLAEQIQAAGVASGMSCFLQTSLHLCAEVV